MGPKEQRDPINELKVLMETSMKELKEMVTAMRIELAAKSEEVGLLNKKVTKLEATVAYQDKEIFELKTQAVHSD